VNSASNPNDPWEVFLPLKQFDAGKSRLGNIPADFRVSLIKAMAVDLIDVLLQTPQIASITIVGVNHQDLINSANPRLRSFPISQPIDINSDLQLAVGDSRRIAIFLPDLPSVKTTEITSFVADQKSIGSTAFFSTVGKVMTHFGINSAAAHRSAQAIELIDPQFKGIKADCDDWSDLLAIDTRDLGHATRALMEHHLQN
jgi:2-phospho-L-lactate guanylyltransferase (CobY/MobA/RfbA family)